mgnify:FL=1
MRKENDRMVVFNGYDQAGLDRAYNNSAKVPNVGDITDGWAKRSAEAVKYLSCDLDVAYGPHPRQCLDVFPTAKRGAPVLVFIHGGYWHSRDKSLVHFLAPLYVAAEVNFVAIGYRLCPEVSVADIVADIAAGLRWLASAAVDFGGDPARIFVAGHSAGGHLAATMCGPKGVPELLAGGCSISGLHDLVPIQHSYLNETLAMDPATARDLSPIQHLLDAGPAPLNLPPQVFAVGDQEGPEYLRQRDDIVAALRAANQPVLTVELADRDHFTALSAAAEPAHPLAEAILRLIFAPPPRSLPKS